MYPALLARSWAVTMRAVRTISRKDRRPDSVAGILRGHTPDARTRAMRWSDLHGDVESWAEPKRPSHSADAEE
jgi:hypothetical protein